MELRRYWEIIKARGWLVVALPLLVLLFSLLTYEPKPPMSAYDLRYSVAFTPTYLEEMSTDPALAAVQATEYIVDDLTGALPGTVFGEMVAARLPQSTLDELRAGGEMTDGEVIVNTILPERIEKTHRLLSISFATPTDELTMPLADAFKATIAEDLTPWLEALWSVAPIKMELVSEEGPYDSREGLPPLVEIALRLFIATVAAVAIAFLLDYLDRTIRNREEVEAIIGPVLGEIPSE